MVLSSTATVFADKPQDVQRFEGSLKVGFGIPFKGYNTRAGYSQGDGPVHWYTEHSAPEFNFVEAQLEIRYNFKNSPWDAGIAIACLRPCYNIKNGFQQGISTTDAFPYIGIVGDYNFGQGKKVNPYVGLGLGMNALENRFMAAPRIGVEILTHLRIEATFYAGNSDDSFFSLSIGAVLGGKPKKAKK